MSSARHSSRSPSRWRWTAGIIKGFGQIYNCPHELHVYGHVDPRHPSVRAAVHGRRDHEGKLEHRHRADRRSGRRRAAEGLSQEDGFPGPGRDRAEGARAHADSRIALGSVRDDDRRLWPWHRGHAAASRDGLCDPVQRRRLSPRRPCSRSDRTIRCRLASASSPRKPATRCARCFAWSSPRAPAGRRMRPVTASAARPAPRKSWSTATTVSAVNVTSFAGVFPMDEPRYVMVMMLDEPKATEETYGFHTAGVEHRRRRSAGRSAGSRRCSASSRT